MSRPPSLRDAAADLLLGSHCVGCARPGRLLCPGCAATLDPAPAAVPDAGPCALAAVPYLGVMRPMVVGHKERGLLALRPSLALLLAAAVEEVLARRAAGPAPVVLVPVPSRRASVRQRGRDPTAELVREAARVLRRRARGAVPVGCVPLLRLRGGVVDQADLGAAAREANLHGAMAARERTLRRLARRGQGVHVVVCDDVVTTGATLREADRALRAGGVPALGAAVVAATPRPGPQRPGPVVPRVHGESSG